MNELAAKKEDITEFYDILEDIGRWDQITKEESWFLSIGPRSAWLVLI